MLLFYFGLSKNKSEIVSYRKERNSVTDLKAHLICVTKYRQAVFDNDALNLVEESFKSVAEKMNFQILEFTGEKDHVHALIEYPPKLSISEILNAIKGVSSRKYGQAGFKKTTQRCTLEPQLLCRLGRWCPC